MVRSDFLRLKADEVTAELVNADISELKLVAKKLFDHATKLGGLGFGSSFLSWVASFSAIGQFAMWIAFIAVVLRLFFPQHFPDWLEIPGSMILLLLVAPKLFTHAFRGSWVGVAICLLIGCYLLQQHIRASGGFRNSFVQRHGISNTIGILLLLIYPLWRLVIHFV